MTGRLRLLIEAESLLNDAAAAVLFGLILAWAAHDPAAAGGPFAVVGAFALIAGGGLLVGLLVGFAAVLVAGTSDDHLVETALSVVAAFGSFLIAQRLGASGVLATVTTGIVMGNLGVLGPRTRFGRPLSAHGRTFVLEFWEFAAFLANSLVFLLIGSAMATIVTDRLRAYSAAMREVGNADRQEVGRGLNNRAENSHQPFRRRERAMQRFRSMKTLQKFSSVHAQVHNHFNHERHLITRQVYKQRRSATLAEWRALAA